METAAVVVSAVAGVEPMTQRMMDVARERGLCRIVVINKIDAREANPEATLEEIREQFGRECLPINLPAAGGSKVVDCFFHNDGEATDFSSVQEAHTQIIDQVVEVDDELMALYLEQGEELEPEQLHDPFEKALREGHLMPVCFVSAETGAGIPELLEVIARLMPNPAEGNPPPFLKGEGDDGAARRGPAGRLAATRSRTSSRSSWIRSSASSACSACTRARSGPARSSSSATGGSRSRSRTCSGCRARSTPRSRRPCPATSARWRSSMSCISTPCCTTRTTRTTST